MKSAWINVNIITVDDNNKIIKNGGIIYEDDIIVNIDKSEVIEKIALEENIETVDGNGKYLFPGMVNTHTHLYQEIMKGMGSDLSLEDWFPTAMAPAGSVLKECHVSAGVKLGLAEAIRCGVTTVADYMQLQPVKGLGEIELDIVKDIGVRMAYGRGYRDIGKKELIESHDDVFEDITKLKSKYEKNDDMIKVWLAPAAGWGASFELLKKTRQYANVTNTPIMMHMFETNTDNNISLDKNGKSAIKHYEETGLLGSDLLAVHSVAMEEEELQKYKEYDVSVSYNPVSNMYLASGVAKVPRMLELGIKVGIATDGAGSNNVNDMFETIKFGALLQKTHHKDPLAMTAIKILRMATIEGAKVLKINHLVGSIEVGKKADFFIFDPLKSIKSCPIHDVVSTLVYSGDYNAVDTVVINGKTVFENNEYLTLDIKEVLEEAQKMANDLTMCIKELKN